VRRREGNLNSLISLGKKMGERVSVSKGLHIRIREGIICLNQGAAYRAGEKKGRQRSK